MSRVTKRYCQLRALDGAAISQLLADVGDFKADALQENNADAVPVIERDVFVSYVYGPEQPITGSFTLNLPKAAITDASTATAIDILRGTGAAASFTTVNAGNFGPLTYKLRYVISMGGVGGTAEFNNCRFKGSVDESGDMVKVSVTFQAFGCTFTA
jgi:hypothetical protein